MQNLSKPGIYKITCIPTQKVYIGQSINVKKRIAAHRSDLKANRHVNDYLQNVVNKYGIENFKFQAIEFPEDTSPENLTTREQYWIDFFDSMNPERGFNLREAGIGTNPTEETRKKMSEAAKRKPPISEETKQKLRGRVPHNKGKSPSEETKQKLREARARQTPHVHTEEERQKMREAAKGNKKGLGKKHTEETKRKISEAKKAYYTSKE